MPNKPSSNNSTTPPPPASCKRGDKPGDYAGMIEYILIAGVNDGPECADELASLLTRRNVMLNLIPYNDTVSQ